MSPSTARFLPFANPSPVRFAAVLLAALGLTAGLAKSAEAQASSTAGYSTKPRTRIELTPQVGYRFEGDVETAFVDSLIDDSEIDEGEVIGLTLGIPVGDFFVLEFLARRQETKLFRDGGLFNEPVDIANLDIDHYHVGTLFEWGDGQVLPFIALSLGLARLDLDVDGASSEDKLSASIGGGVKILFSEHFGLRFEGRGFWTNLSDNDRNDRCRDRRRDCFDGYEDDGIYQMEATAGLVLRF